MEEGVQVGHALLRKKNGNSSHFWEAVLLRHEITGDFKIKRRWKIHKRAGQNANMKDWHETDWDLDGHKKFRWKVLQKIKFSNYKIEKYTPYENEPSLEMLQELEGD